MTEQQAAEMLAKLKSIEQLLMRIANNTSDAIPCQQRIGTRTRFLTSALVGKTSDETITPVK